MKLNSADGKGFIIGVVASITAVIVWDIIKNKYQIFNYKSKTSLDKHISIMMENDLKIEKNSQND